MRLPFFELSGTCHEQGQVHGEALKDLIEKNIAVYFRRFQKEAKLSKDEVLERTGYCLHKLKKQSKKYYDGITGIAEGSNHNLLEIAMLNFRYELLYHAISKLQMDAVDGCTSYAVLPEVASNGHTFMGQNWDWIPDVECAIVETTVQDGPHQLAFTEAGIFGGKIGINSEGLALTVNGMNSIGDDWSRFKKPFHLRCADVLESKTLEDALDVLIGTPRSCTANFMIGQAQDTVIDIELATDECNIDGALKHAVQTIEQEGEDVEIVVWMQANFPLREKGEIDVVIQKLITTGADSVCTMSPVGWPLEKAFKIYEILSKRHFSVSLRIVQKMYCFINNCLSICSNKFNCPCLDGFRTFGCITHHQDRLS
mgnify:CR=1 FL=1